MLEIGFRLFAKNGIETVSMQEVADACGIGIATLYRYFSTKPDFVIAIGAKKWTEYFEEVEEEYARRGGDLMDAAEELDFYLNSYILLYREHPDVLRFNQNFNGFILHEQATPRQMGDYLSSIGPFRMKFHRLYEKGVTDGSIRTDEPEETMFNVTMHIMLAVCCRFAQGVVYQPDDPEDLTKELMILKRLILGRYARQSF
ncbi:MAG: TetR/AcrR family transcriptional regulator [Clostridia bacterium]|nr:TetR/AcrR family transcriptional regulator [Clostridia bacterium]